jgi:hypothetical protein
MQRLIVLRVALGLVTLFTGAALVFGWATAPPSHPVERAISDSGDRGVSLFEQRCGRCHTRVEMLEWLGRSTETDPGSALLNFLEEHGEASGPENRAIVVHLESLAAPR